MSDDDIVKRDRAALCAMLDAALSRAGARPTAMVDFGLPRLSTEAELLAKAGATRWTADRDYLARTWRPSGFGAQVAPHPANERVDVPPPALVASSRLP